MERKLETQVDRTIQEDDPYKDLYDRDHPVSKKHPQMSLQQRAAQFAPFAALVGYEDMIDEAGVKYREDRSAEEAGVDIEMMTLADDGE